MPEEARSATRARIVERAAALLRERGPAAVTTRGVADAAGVQAPTIYRLFGDKDGLLEAVAEHVMTGYVAAKSAAWESAEARLVDPVADLRAGWADQIAFGLANPTLFALLSAPDRVRQSPAAASGRRVLERRVARIAAAGLLRVTEDRAVGLIQAAGTGTIQTLLATPEEHRDPGLADTMLDAVLQQILRTVSGSADDHRTVAVVTLRALLPDLAVLSDAERALLRDWLDRIIGIPEAP